MDVSELVVSAGAPGTFMDWGVLLFGGLLVVALFTGAGVLALRMTGDGIFLAGGLFGGIIMAIGFLITAAIEGWRPVSGPEYRRVYAEAAENQARAFWMKYVRTGSEDLAGPALAREIVVRVEVTRIEHLVRYRRRRSTALPYRTRVEGKDGNGRIWVFSKEYDPDNRNPQLGDHLRLELKLAPGCFGQGCVYPERISWEA